MSPHSNVDLFGLDDAPAREPMKNTAEQTIAKTRAIKKRNPKNSDSVSDNAPANAATTNASIDVTADLPVAIVNEPETVPCSKNVVELANAIVPHLDDAMDSFEELPPLFDDLPPIKRKLFRSLTDMMEKPHKANWLIRDYLELNTLALTFGESGAGKSFAVLDMALCVATGKDWRGHKVEQGAVFYIAGEGQGGIAKRCSAWGIAHNVSLHGVPFYTSHSAIGLPDTHNLRNLLAEIDELATESGHAPKMVILDTLARSLIGDENNAKDAGAFIQALDAIRLKYDCCVMVVHHSGKDASKGGRGSSAIKAAMDTELCVTKTGDLHALSVTKQKEHEPPPDKFFTLKPVPTQWANEDGSPICSAVMVESDYTAATVQRESDNAGGLSKRDTDVLNTLKTLIEQDGDENGKGVYLEKWRTLAYQVIEAEKPSAKKVSFQRARTSLLNSGLIESDADGIYWSITGRNKRNNSGTVPFVPLAENITEQTEQSGTKTKMFRLKKGGEAEQTEHAPLGVFRCSVSPAPTDAKNIENETVPLVPFRQTKNPIIDNSNFDGVIVNPILDEVRL